MIRSSKHRVLNTGLGLTTGRVGGHLITGANATTLREVCQFCANRPEALKVSRCAASFEEWTQ